MSFKRPEAGGAPERGVGDGNGAIVEMVRQGILKAREKLIDRSLRNGMLNYRHLESSSRHVRIVHQSERGCGMPRLREEHRSRAVIVRAMKDHFGLARLAMTTRQRFEAAVACSDPEA
jgi:hypothetical protein